MAKIEVRRTRNLQKLKKNQLGNRFQSKKTSRWVWNATFSLKKAFYGSEKAPKELQEGFLEAPREPKRGATEFDAPAAPWSGALGKGGEGVNPSPEIGDWV